MREGEVHTPSGGPVASLCLPPSPQSLEGASLMAIPSSWDVQSRIHTNPTPSPQPTPQLTLDLNTPLSHFWAFPTDLTEEMRQGQGTDG